MTKKDALHEICSWQPTTKKILCAHSCDSFNTKLSISLATNFQGIMKYTTPNHCICNALSLIVDFSTSIGWAMTKSLLYLFSLSLLCMLPYSSLTLCLRLSLKLTPLCSQNNAIINHVYTYLWNWTLNLIKFSSIFSVSLRPGFSSWQFLNFPQTFHP